MVRQNGSAPGNFFNNLGNLKAAAVQAGATTLVVTAESVVYQQLVHILTHRYGGVMTGAGSLGGVDITIVFKLQ